VNVLAARESLDQYQIVGQVGEHAELHLRIVSRDQATAGVSNECRADAQPEFVADGNVLEVRVGRGKASGARHGWLKVV